MAERFLAASSVPVIRVDLKPPPAHLRAWQVSHTRIPTRRGSERRESTSGAIFPRAEAGLGQPVPVLRISGSVASWDSA
jgi:hypothetical protein